MPECEGEGDPDVEEAAWPTPVFAQKAMLAVANGIKFKRAGKSTRRWLSEARAIGGSIHALTNDWGINADKHTIMEVDADGNPTVVGTASDYLTAPALATTQSLGSPSAGLSCFGITSAVARCWYFEHWSGNSDWFGWTLGTHGASIGGYRRNPPYQSRHVYGKWCMCGHGRCPWLCDDLGLYTILRGSSVETGLYYKCGFTVNDPYRGATPYLSKCNGFWGLGVGFHLCNDDVLVSYRSVLDGVGHNYDWTCFDTINRNAGVNLFGCG